MTEPSEGYACPFCGELSTSKSRGKHFAYHRRIGDAPLPLRAEIAKGDDGLWHITASLDSGAPVLVPKHYQSRKTKPDAEKALRLFMKGIAKGTDTKPVSTARPAHPSEKKAPPPEGITNQAAIDALAKMTGITAIPTSKIDAVVRWAEATRSLVKEITR